MRVNFPSDYPFKPPRVRFATRKDLDWHPNINRDGEISIGILSDSWSPAVFLQKILAMVSQMLHNPDRQHPMNPEAADLWERDRAQYDKGAIGAAKASALWKGDRDGLLRDFQAGDGSGWKLGSRVCTKNRIPEGTSRASLP